VAKKVTVIREELVEWDAFLGRIARARRAVGADEDNAWYRGQLRSEWALLPSLLRLPDDVDSSEVEVDLYYEFAARARELHSARLDSWEILLIMRHHGLATRLLDWTDKLGIALYFALHDWHDEPSEVEANRLPVVWVLNPFELNAASGSWEDEYLVSPSDLFQDTGFTEYVDVIKNREDWPYRKPVAIYPRQVSSRQQAQGGWFTIHGKSSKPLDQIAKAAVRKVVLTPGAVRAGKEFLKIAGLNEYLLFPDLDGLARSLHDRYGLTPIPSPLAALGTIPEVSRRPRQTAQRRKT